MKCRNIWQKIDFILEKILSWYVIVAEIAAIAIMLLSVVDVVGSKFFNQGIPSAIELVEQLNVPLVFGAIAFVAIERGHIRIDSLDAAWSTSVKYLLKIFSRIVEMAVCGFLSWRSLILVQDMIEKFARSTGSIMFPLLPFGLSVLIGFILLTVAAILGIGREIMVKQGGKIE
ncbi:MAG: hypothetical protein A2Z02_03540 [Chloroflexi bacterium RBG_16_48_7]|nr:MAG: hypothetical protein A2Z02_03540 [Chloroflexi bacterium RBG_16_48_7]